MALSLESQVADLQSKVDSLPTRDEIEILVNDAMVKAIFRVGKTSKIAIVTIATIIGSVAVIGGGLKWFLNIIGFVRLQ